MDKYDRADTYPVGDHTLDGTHTPSHTHTLHAGTSYDMIESHPALFATPPPLLPLSLTRFLCSVLHSAGYTTKMVVHERFAIIIPKEYPMQYAGPVMCAGVTLFDPLRRYKATTGTRVAIVGLGGLGQMGVKIAKAMGCVVTVVSRSVSKQKFATDCGASSFVCSEDAAQMKVAAKSFDLVLNTIPAHHDYQTYTNLVAKGGKHIILGLNAGLAGGLVLNAITMKQSKVVGSGIGGIEATQAVINLCHENKIFPEIQIVRAEQINEVYEKLDSSNQDGVRYVLDIQGTKFSKSQRFIEPSV